MDTHICTLTSGQKHSQETRRESSLVLPDDHFFSDIGTGKGSGDTILIVAKTCSYIGENDV